MERYLTIREYGENEITINKSKFICYLGRATTEKEASNFIKKIKKQNWNATHNCSAYIIGENRNAQKANDDGEPSGTAGIPMLETIKKNNLTDIVAVVTRYFGGIKLGAGGLIRAYGKSVSECINSIEIVEKKKMQNLSLSFNYNLVGAIDKFITENNINVINKSYLADVLYEIIVSQDDVSNVIDKFIDLTNSNIKIERLDFQYYEIPVKKATLS